MTRAYNVVDADGHILEPLDLWDDYIDPKFRDRGAALRQGRQRQGAARSSRAAARQRAAGIGSLGAVGVRQGVVKRRHAEIQGGQARRVRPARAHPRHGCRRHRRRLPLSEPRPVRRRGRGSRARRRDVPRLQPLARRLLQARIPTGCSGSRCCRCSRSSSRSTRCASPAKSSASAAAFLRPNPYHGNKMINDPMYEPFWAAAEDLDFSIGFHEGASTRHADGRRRPLRGRAARGTSSRTRWR